MKKNITLKSLLFCLVLLAANTVNGQNYSISTAGSAIIITDNSGNTDELVITESGASINFSTVAARTYSLNGGATTAFPVSVPLAGIISVTVNAEAGTDVINVGAFTAALPDFTINGGTGNDAVLFNGDINFATNASLNADLQNDDASPGIDRVTLASNINLKFSGTGGATIRVSRDIQLNGGSSIETVDGNIVAEANQQATPTAADFEGIDINGGFIQCSGTGIVTVKGKGGNTGNNKYGIHLRTSGKIIGGTAGLVSVQGNGGPTTGSFNYGIYVQGANALIGSNGGNVNVTAQGGGTGAGQNNLGLSVDNGGIIAAGGSGTTTVLATGGLTSGIFNAGIFLSGTNSAINSGGGNVIVTATGGGSGSSPSNLGIYMLGGSKISAGGTGTVSVQATGGTTTAGGVGLYLTGANTTITSSGGNVTVAGTGKATGSATDVYGVYAEAAAIITAGGSGNVSVNGIGGLATGNYNFGVYIYGASTSITSAGGHVNVTGQGGGSGASSSNHGVYVYTSALIAATGSGTVTVQGTGGTTSTGGSCFGVLVTTSDARITSSGGNVSVTGNAGGGASSGQNYGVYVESTGIISAGGSGTVNVQGIGKAPSSGAFNVGVYVNNLNSKITSSGGNVTVTGTGGGSAASGFNLGVLVQSSGLITAGGSGSVLVNGTGGSSTGDNNAGVAVYNAGSITTAGGNLSIIGLGGGTGVSKYNYGVWIQGGSTVSSSVTGFVSVGGTGGSPVGSFNYGVYVADPNSIITSAGGSVSVTGLGGGIAGSTNNMGVFLETGGVITSGNTGIVTVQGTGGASTGNFNHGIHMNGLNTAIKSAGGPVNVTGTAGGTGVSSNSVGVFMLNAATITAGGSGAVYVYGTGGPTGGADHGVLISGASTITSGGGNVSVTGLGGGSGAANDIYGVYLELAAVISAGGSGFVSVNGTGGPASGSYNFGVYVNGLNSVITSSGGNVSVTGQGGGSGSSASNHGIYVYNQGLISAGGSGNVTIHGTAGTNSTGGNNQGVVVNGTNSRIITSGGNVNVTGFGGGSGATSVLNFGVYVEGAGIISAGGIGTVSVTGTGGAAGGLFNVGVYVNNANSRINSAGGNVHVTGTGGGSGSSSFNFGVLAQNTGMITAGTGGSVLVEGTGGTTTTGDNNPGVGVVGGSSITTSTVGNVSIIGHGGGSGMSNTNYGVWVSGASVVTASGTGTVNVDGTGGTSTGNYNYGVYVDGLNSKIISNGGAGSVTGHGGGSGASVNNFGVFVETSGVISANGIGTMTVLGYGGLAGGNFNTGVFLSGTNTAINSSGGSLFVTGYGGGSGLSSNNLGVFVSAAAKIIAGGSGLVSVTGFGGPTGGSDYGVYVSGTNSTITSMGGNVNVSGTGGGMGFTGLNYGLFVENAASISVGGSGTLTVIGAGGINPTGANNYGVYVSTANAMITSAGGLVIIDATEGGGPTGTGIVTDATAAITTATYGGFIFLFANSMDIRNTSTVSANSSSTVSLKTKDSGIQIDLGSGTDPIGGPLSFSDTELNRVAAGSLLIGSGSSGTITVSAPIARTIGTNMVLSSGGDVVFGGGGINTNGGTLLLDPGTAPAAVKPIFIGVDVTASTLSFYSDLAIVINGIVANTDYTQLSVAGLVDISGVDLVLSGSHSPLVGEQFIIINNDGVDAITSTFNGLAEGATIFNFLGFPNCAIITYVGGDGNDAVLTVFPPPPGAALSFDGVDDRIVSGPMGVSVSTKTMSAWVRLNTLSQGGGGLVSLETSDGSVFDAIVYNETGMGWGFGSEYFNRTAWSGFLETTMEWVHLAATYEDNSYKLYRNGVLILTETSYAVVPFPTNARVLVGNRHTGGGSSFLDAQIDEVRVWNHALTQAEIVTNMNCEIPARACGLLINYHLNQGLAYGINNSPADYTVIDAASGDHDGSLENFALIGYTSNWATPGGVTTGVSCVDFIPDLSGVVSVGIYPSNTYPSLSGPGGLFEDINARGLCGNLIVMISSDVTEPGTIALNPITYHQTINYYTVSVQPGSTSVKLLSGNVANAMIRLSGADRVTIDGNLNGSGPYLRFRNSNTSFPTLSFTNGASNNIITHCYIDCLNTASNSGGVVIGGSTALTGNENITFISNHFSNYPGTAIPSNLVYSSGTVGKENGDIAFWYNKFSNFNQNGINVTGTGNGSNWLMAFNTFFWDHPSPATLAQCAINFIPGAASTGNVIQANGFGGSFNNITGTWLNSGAVTLKAVSVSAGEGTVSMNEVTNFFMTSPGLSTFIGIEILSGNVVVNQNTIGSASAPDAIRMAGLSNFFGIRSMSASGSIQLQENIIANVTATAASGYPNFYGIYARTGVITKNRVFKLGSTSTLSLPSIYGIENLGFPGVVTDYANNRVALDGGNAKNPKIFGIQDNGYSATSPLPSARYAHNSVEITGLATTSAKTYAFQRNFNGIVDIKNNIFANRRTTSPVGHYAISSANTANWSSNFNDLNTASTWIGYWGATNRTTLAVWKAATAQDVNSISVVPVFTADLHLDAMLNPALNNVCTALAWVTDDIDTDLRSGLVDFGADEIGAGPRIGQAAVASAYGLNAYPNPFTNSVQLTVNVSQDSKISLSVFNMIGEKIADITEENLSAGVFEYTFHADNLPAGVYVCRMIVMTGDKTDLVVKRLVKDR